MHFCSLQRSQRVGGALECTNQDENRVDTCDRAKPAHQDASTIARTVARKKMIASATSGRIHSR